MIFTTPSADRIVIATMASDDADAPNLLTSEQVTERLALEPDLRRVAMRCVLRAVRIDGAVRFRRTDLDNWIAIARLESSRSGRPAEDR